MAELKRHTENKSEHKLGLAEVVSLLVADGVVRAEDASSIRSIKPQKDPAEGHPLVVIGTRGLSSAKAPHKALTVESLTMWLASRVGLAFQRIDPLKIDVTSVTAVMSYNYAKHLNILCVAAHADK